MSKLDKALEKTFGKKKPKIVQNAVERLNPPPPPPIPRTPPRTEALDSMVHATYNLQPKGIDFSYLANNSSFQRAIMEFIKKFVPGFENVKHRGSKEVMKQSFNQNAHNYQKVMIELKEKLAERRKKADGH